MSKPKNVNQQPAVARSAEAETSKIVRQVVLPPEALSILSNAYSVARKDPWGQPSVYRHSKDGRKWKATQEGQTIVLFGESGRHAKASAEKRKRALEEQLQPVITRKETLAAILGRSDIVGDVREQYEAQLEEATEKLASLEAQIAAQVVPETELERFEFPLKGTFTVTVTA